MKIISLIILISGILRFLCFGQNSDTTIYVNPENQPTFKYDTCANLKSSVKSYFMENYKMPEMLISNGYSGSIYIEFVIEKDGSLSNINIIRGIDDPLDKSIIETIKLMSKWEPGINNGEIVRTKIVIPVSIRWLYGKNEIEE